MKFPVPEKFNDHNLSTRHFPVPGNDTVDLLRHILAFTDSTNLAKQIVAKWFQRDSEGDFSMDLVAERGQYDASEMDVNIARHTTRGMNVLADAGEELIGNSFVLISSFRFISKEEMGKKADTIRETSNRFKQFTKTMQRQYHIPESGLEKLDLSPRDENKINTLGAIGRKGYVVIASSYLFCLDWNDSVSSFFYNNLWMDKGTHDQQKKAAFDSTHIFGLKYIGHESTWADLQSTIFTHKKEEELVQIATVKVIDAVIAKLQRKHDEFKTSTPIIATEPLSARIGLKEGLEANDRYQVLEQTVTNEGRTVYKEIGIVKVDKSHIWDNRYMATGDLSNGENCTHFIKVSGHPVYEGMLLKQKPKNIFPLLKFRK